jgi:hypothetical protein
MKTLVTRIFQISVTFFLSGFFISNNAYAHCKVYHPHHCEIGKGKIGELPDGTKGSGYQDVIIGGVNLTPWCKSKFGKKFKARLIGKTAGDWTCEQTQGNRRPISVTAACKLQYGKKAKKSKAQNWNDPYSWKCIAREKKETLKGVNLTPWCKSKFGSGFKAKLIGRTAGDWVCEQSRGNRRLISVTSACKLQYGKKAKTSKALDWNDPYSWKCILRL